MKTFLRWLKFNVVGFFGTVFQLAALAILNRTWPGNYLLTSSIALELTLLHNFVWHLQYTWRDRRSASPWQTQCARFHATVGTVSLLGNLGLMRVLVRDLKLPVLAANLVAILVCSLVNFYIGNRWAFTGARSESLPNSKIAGSTDSNAHNLTNNLPAEGPCRLHYAIVPSEVQT